MPEKSLKRRKFYQKIVVEYHPCHWVFSCTLNCYSYSAKPSSHFQDTRDRIWLCPPTIHLFFALTSVSIIQECCLCALRVYSMCVLFARKCIYVFFSGAVHLVYWMANGGAKTRAAAALLSSSVIDLLYSSFTIQLHHHTSSSISKYS